MKQLLLIIGLTFFTSNIILCQSIETKIREFSKQEYPNDYKMQDYIYNKQLSAYKYMLTVTDGEVKKMALREYPNDYSMQKYIYNKQLSAKQYMASIPSSSAKSRAIREYPNDYSMQKYIYNKY